MPLSALTNMGGKESASDLSITFSRSCVVETMLGEGGMATIVPSSEMVHRRYLESPASNFLSCSVPCRPP